MEPLILIGRHANFNRHRIKMGIMGKAGARLTREDWLHQALQILREEGVHGVRVERVALHHLFHEILTKK